MAETSILALLGGRYHDFDGFATAMRPVLEGAGHRVTVTYELDRLLGLQDGAYEVLAMYTCMGMQTDDAETAPPVVLTSAQTESLVGWVRGGGGLLALHAATVFGQTSPALRALMGGVFVDHPPPFNFTVCPMSGEHPITADVSAFSVHDEFYVQSYDETVGVHMVAVDRGVAYPMVWSKTEGLGRVAHVAIGHGPEVWALEPFQRLTLQAIQWLVG